MHAFKQYLEIKGSVFGDKALQKEDPVIASLNVKQIVAHNITLFR